MSVRWCRGGVKPVDWIRSGADDADQLSHPVITGPPKSQHLTDRRHGNLPECHLPGHPDPALWKHPYRQVTKTPGATRRVVPSLATGWSHVGDGKPAERSHDHGGRLLSIRAPSRHNQGVPN